MLKQTSTGGLSQQNLIPDLRIIPTKLSVARWGELPKVFKLDFRTYQGVARIIRRRMVIAVAAALVWGTIAILMGFLFFAKWTTDLPAILGSIALFFVIGLLLNGWLVLRLTRQPLRDIERVEATLVKMIEAGRLNNLEVASDLSNFHTTPFLQAFNALLTHVDAIETRHLEFLGKVTHDIRSPVASILGYSELLTDPDLRHNPQFIDQTYQVIRKQGNQVCRFLEESILAATIDSGHYDPKFAEFDLGQLINRLADEARHGSGREINLTDQVGNVRMQGDAVGLREAINHLIDNSLRFSPPGTPVSIGLRYSEEPGWVEVSIEDHGFGIDDQDKPTLFRRFSRIRNEQTAGISGNGLGLYIAQQIAQYHHGTITVASQPQAGSTFTLHLPVKTNSR